MLNSVSVPEKVAKRKVIVYKAHVDQKAVRLIAEKMKTQLFRKFFIMKPKPDEVQIISIEKYFDPYVIVDGEYNIEYSKKWTRNIQVDDTMQELTIFGGKTKPASLKDHLKTPCKIIKLNGEGRYKINEKAHLIFDSQWHEVGFDELPYVPFEEQPETILNTLDQRFGKNMMNSKKEVELLKSRIVHRPKGFLTVHNEMFKVSERALIYKPMYRVTCQNTKTKKVVTMSVDAITGKTSTDTKPTVMPKQKPIKKHTTSTAKNVTDKNYSPDKKTEDEKNKSNNYKNTNSNRNSL